MARISGCDEQGASQLECGDVAAGAMVVVAVRPERVGLAPSRPGLHGTVTDVIYVGNVRKYVVRLADGEECLVLRHVDPAASNLAAPGERAVVSWEPRHATAFPA